MPTLAANMYRSRSAHDLAGVSGSRHPLTGSAAAKPLQASAGPAFAPALARVVARVVASVVARVVASVLARILARILPSVLPRVLAPLLG